MQFATQHPNLTALAYVCLALNTAGAIAATIVYAYMVRRIESDERLTEEE